MSATPPVPRLFVYGSLRMGSANPHAAFLHARSRPLGSGKMPGRLYRAGPQHVAVYEQESASHVWGDVLELPPDRAEEMLTSLDRYEGIGTGLPKPATFRRDRVNVALEDGAVVECWAWLYDLPVKGCSHLRHGDSLKG